MKVSAGAMSGNYAMWIIIFQSNSFRCCNASFYHIWPYHTLSYWKRTLSSKPDRFVPNVDSDRSSCPHYVSVLILLLDSSSSIQILTYPMEHWNESSTNVNIFFLILELFWIRLLPLMSNCTTYTFDPVSSFDLEVAYRRNKMFCKPNVNLTMEIILWQLERQYCYWWKFFSDNSSGPHVPNSHALRKFLIINDRAIRIVFRLFNKTIEHCPIVVLNMSSPDFFKFYLSVDIFLYRYLKLFLCR